MTRSATSSPLILSLTVNEYNRLLEAQGGVCAICTQPPPRHELVLDRCHETGVTRGLLCVACKAALHAFRANEDLLRSAMGYLAANDTDGADVGAAGSLRRLRRPLRGQSAPERREAASV